MNIFFIIVSYGFAAVFFIFSFIFLLICVEALMDKEFEYFFGFGLLGLFIGLMCWAILWETPISGKDYFYRDIAKYYDVQPQKDGSYLVIDLDDLQGKRQFDLRFIDAAKNGKLYIEKNDKFNWRGECVESVRELKY